MTSRSSSPQVSVCIPVHNAMPYLPATIAAALDQRDVDHEVVVRDNASTDGSAEFLRGLEHPRLRIEYGTELIPLPDNFRRVTELTRGALVKLVCADDLIAPQACAHQAAVFSADPGLALVASRRDIIDATGAVLAPAQGLRGLLGHHHGAAVIRTVLLRGHNAVGEPGGVMFRRADYDRIGGWDGRRIYPMDLDLWTRLLHCGHFHGLPEALAAFRVSPTGISARRSRSQFLEHRDLAVELATDPRWRVPPWLQAWTRPAATAAWWSWTVRQYAASRRAAQP